MFEHGYHNQQHHHPEWGPHPEWGTPWWGMHHHKHMPKPPMSMTPSVQSPVLQGIPGSSFYIDVEELDVANRLTGIVVSNYNKMKDVLWVIDVPKSGVAQDYVSPNNTITITRNGLEVQFDVEQSILDTINQSVSDIIALQGDVTNLQGDVTNLQGDVTNLQGDVTNLQGDVTNLQGDVNSLTTAYAQLLTDLQTLQSDVSSLSTSITNIQGDITVIQDLIPTNASPTNQLTTDDDLNYAVSRMAGHYITKTSAGDDLFDSLTDLQTATTVYYGGNAFTPTEHDYAIYANSTEGTWFCYYAGGQWVKGYEISADALDPGQMDAINSGIDQTLVDELQTAVNEGLRSNLVVVNDNTYNKVNFNTEHRDKNGNLQTTFGGGILWDSDTIKHSGTDGDSEFQLDVKVNRASTTYLESLININSAGKLNRTIPVTGQPSSLLGRDSSGLLTATGLTTGNGLLKNFDTQSNSITLNTTSRIDRPTGSTVWYRNNGQGSYHEGQNQKITRYFVGDTLVRATITLSSDDSSGNGNVPVGGEIVVFSLNQLFNNGGVLNPNSANIRGITCFASSCGIWDSTPNYTANDVCRISPQSGGDPIVSIVNKYASGFPVHSGDWRTFVLDFHYGPTNI